MRRSRYRTRAPLNLILLNVFDPVDDVAADFEISRTLLQPAPALERARADAPATSEIDLVEVLERDRAFDVRRRLMIPPTRAVTFAVLRHRYRAEATAAGPRAP